MSSDKNPNDEVPVVVEGTDLLPPSPSFITQSFESQTVSRHHRSTPSVSASGSSAWPISYQVHTLGQRGRAPKPSPLVFSASSGAPTTSGTQQSPSPRSVGFAQPPQNPFASPPSTPGTSVRSFVSAASSSSNVSMSLPPVPTTPPPIPPRTPNIDLYGPPSPTQATDVNGLSPARAAEQPRVHRPLHRPSSADQASTSQSANLMQRAPRPRHSRGSRTPVITTPAISRPTTPKERNSFASPPVLPMPTPTIITPGVSTPSSGTVRPSTSNSTSSLSMHSRFSSVALRLSHYAQQDQADTLDFSGVSRTLKGMEATGDYFGDASFSTISVGSSVYEKQATLRPSRLLQGEVQKPWLKQKDWRVTASWWITLFTALIGVGASVAICINGYRNVPMITAPLCLIMEDNFDKFDSSIWQHEVDMSGFGNGEFEMTTASPNNSYVKDGKLYMVPTLTRDVIGEERVLGQGANEGFLFNVTGCTNHDNPDACGAIANATKGTIINPVMSARLTTQKSHSILYGKVEIRAKLPVGDWLWPAFWMLPVDSKYGPWPVSGEIDIMEARGNGPTYPNEGLNYVRSSLNWGPTIALNRAFKTFNLWFDRRGNFGNGFHTFTLEWTQDFLRVFVDSRLRRTLDLRFNVPFFDRGDFPQQIMNESQSIPLQNPWQGRGNSAPFDQPFFLIMNIAVGGTNGWFPDTVGSKPWLDGSRTAMRDFAQSQDQWYPTWPEDPEERGMVVDYVKMWQQC